MKPFSLYVGLTRCLHLNSRSDIVASASAFGGREMGAGMRLGRCERRGRM